MADTGAVCQGVKVVLRGTERYHMEAYFLKRGYIQAEADVFTMEGLRAVFGEQQKVPLGAIELTEVTVCFRGARELAAFEAARFRLQFLTAGG